MLRAIAIDDEPLALRQIDAYIKRLSPLICTEQMFGSAVEAQVYLMSHTVDLIFVDINMPDMSGVEFVSSLKSSPMVIFTTAYSEYAIDGFRLDAVDYLLKPFSFAEFSRSVNKAYALHELRQGRATTESAEASAEANATEEAEYISVKADYKTTLVKVSDIVYVESEGEYIRLHLRDKSTITTFFRLKNIETTLPSSSFMRIHRSYIVNLGEIKSYIKGRVSLNDGQYLPIGDSYKELFMERMGRISTIVSL